MTVQERSMTAVVVPAMAGRTAARLAKHLEVSLGAVDLSLPQYRMLVYLTDGSAAASALASKLAVSRPSVTALVDGLVARGLVARQVDPADRRRVALTITAKGRKALTSADRAVDARLGEVAAHLPDEERAIALDAMALWLKALDAHREARVNAR